MTFLTYLCIFFLTLTICSASEVEYKTIKDAEPRPPGCYYKDAYYSPNSEILSVEDKDEDLCYGLICNDQGDIIHWDDFDCFTREDRSDDSLPPSRPKRYGRHQPHHPRPTPRPTKPPGCELDGKFYMPGEEISKGVDGNWCYGMFCGEDGHLIAWDNWDCFPSKKTTTTGPPPLEGH